MEVRNSQPFHTSVNENSDENGDPKATFSKLIGRKLSNNSSADVYSLCWVKFTRDAVLTKSPNFMNLGLSPVHASDEFVSFSIPNTRIGSPTDGYNWIPPVRCIGEVIADRMSRTRSDQNCISKTDFETRTKIKILSAKINL